MRRPQCVVVSELIGPGFTRGRDTFRGKRFRKHASRVV